ncbi:prolyl oligopeptidase [Conidiobolus coronatus NRRL 28638]|uniref:Prolyl endopeptidase n=1 Tax=Conidiobolus coronatus (strain ATCC 28846 / CBS 209.66 / NRRL 28638) TaxID=796925 RepID=A0A137P1B1_CONC2|nr:prolyl oligopeptidase [Conidiobolus coronatus NRRL 28638]|eukprot:KXN68748.1 prolyl oligopeptidase [Conidiobolus coronatus NRRL 28638]
MIFNSCIQLICLALIAKGQPANSTSEKDLAVNSQATRNWSYPLAPRDDNASDIFWGKTVQDPYRPLTKPLDPKTLKFIEESNAFTSSILELDATRSEIRKAIQRYGGQPIEHSYGLSNGYMYSLYNSGEQDQAVIARRYLGGPRITLVDPNMLFEKGTTKILNFSISPDGKYLAYTISRKGSDWESIYVMDLVYLNQVSEILWTRYNERISWLTDSSGFYYRSYAPANGITFDQAGLENEPPKYLSYNLHTVKSGRSQEFFIQNLADISGHQSHKLININDRFMLSIVQSVEPESEDNNYGSKARLVELEQGIASAKDFVLSSDGDHYIKYLRSDNEGMVFITDVGAPNRHVVKVKFDSLDKYEIIVSEFPDKMIEYQIEHGNRVALFSIWDGISFAAYIENGERKEINLPFGRAWFPQFTNNGNSITFLLTSFLQNQFYRYDFDKNSFTIEQKFDHRNFDSSKFVEYRALYTAKDGTEVPILITHRKGIKPDQSHAGFLYGYGGFNTMQSPRYDEFWAYLLQEKDMVIAIALVRGGNERGERWRYEGIQENKYRSYSDYADAVEFLHSDPKYGFVGKNMQFINGASNGGLLTSATCNLIPEKLGGCIADVGVHDLLRYSQFTVGDGWKDDYGKASDSKDMFNSLMKISPLENVLPPVNGTQTKFYPPYLINTADYDDRVSPLHSLKLAATIQNNHRNSPHPTLLYVAHRSGHSPSSRTKYLDKCVNAVSFINIVLKKLY